MDTQHSLAGTDLTSRYLAWGSQDQQTWSSYKSPSWFWARLVYANTTTNSRMIREVATTAYKVDPNSVSVLLVITRSNLWPNICVGSVTCCSSPSDSSTSRKFTASIPFGTSTWILKSPRTSKRSFDKITDTIKSANSFIRKVLMGTLWFSEGGVLWTIIILNLQGVGSCTSSSE